MRQDNHNLESLIQEALAENEKSLSSLFNEILETDNKIRDIQLPSYLVPDAKEG